MISTLKPFSYITDFLTGKQIPNIGTEESRQAVERILVHEKGFDKSDIEVDVEISFEVKGDRYSSLIDLVVSTDAAGRTMLVKCCAGSLHSCQREVIAAARILDRKPIPFAAALNGDDAVIWDTGTGKKIAEGKDGIPSKSLLEKLAAEAICEPLPPAKVEKERLIFRTYDQEYVNVLRR